MNWQDELEAVRINASRGSLWGCSPNQASVVAWRLDELFTQILIQEFEYDLDPKNKNDKQFVRYVARIPFLVWLFGDADYGEWRRTLPIRSARDLTSGEASALFDFMFTGTAYDVLTGWLRDSDLVTEREIEERIHSWQTD